MLCKCVSRIRAAFETIDDTLPTIVQCRYNLVYTLRPTHLHVAPPNKEELRVPLAEYCDISCHKKDETAKAQEKDTAPKSQISLQSFSAARFLL